MKRVKNIAMMSVVLLCVASLIAGYVISGNWMIRFKSELNDFFGEGNWKRVSEETKESIMYSNYVTVRSNPALSGEVPGKFKNWYISYTNKDGKEELWKLTNHTLKINNDRNHILSPKRLSSKQAFYLELMDISFGSIGEEVYNEVIRSVLSEEEANSIMVTMSYRGGHPKPEVYDALAEKEWFTANKASAEDFLAWDIHDFYIDIMAFDYKLNNLDNKQRQNVLNSLHTIEQALLDKYGEHASFAIYFDDEHDVEYTDGRKH